MENGFLDKGKHKNSRQLFTIRELKDHPKKYHIVTYTYCINNTFPWKMSAPLKNGRVYDHVFDAYQACAKHMQSASHWSETRIFMGITYGYHWDTDFCEYYWDLATKRELFIKVPPPSKKK